MPDDQMRLTGDAFIVHDDEILLLERHEGLWYIPGGVVELDEDPATAARRETREEPDHDVPDLEILRCWSCQLRDSRWVPDGDLGTAALTKAHDEDPAPMVRKKVRCYAAGATIYNQTAQSA